MLVCNQIIKISELDHFQNGCSSDFSEYVFDHTIQGETLDQITEIICNFLNCSNDFICINPVEDEPNRIDVQVTENKAGYKPSKYEYEQFKLGDKRLWCCTYIFYFNFLQVPNLLEF